MSNQENEPSNPEDNGNGCTFCKVGLVTLSILIVISFAITGVYWFTQLGNLNVENSKFIVRKSKSMMIKQYRSKATIKIEI